MDERKGILLESGTNELEIVEFRIGENSFGINAAKVKEIVRFTPATQTPLSHPCIRGVIMLRDQVMNVIDLPKYLHMEESDSKSIDLYLIAQFNQLTVAFLVHGVDRIHRFSWKDIEPPAKGLSQRKDSSVTGIVKMPDRMILILDFERIMMDISPETGIQASEIESMTSRTRSDRHILLAEDSALLSKMILTALEKSGYVQVTAVQNGQAALEQLLRWRDDPDVPLEEHVSCVITDLEMPQMDGHSLTKTIKEDRRLCGLPVIIFSSIIDEQMRLKGNEVGADEQISKPEIGRLVSIIDRLVLRGS